MSTQQQAASNQAATVVGFNPFERLASVDTTVTPAGLDLTPVKDDEAVVGVASDEVVRLFHLTEEMKARALAFLAQVDEKEKEHEKLHDLDEATDESCEDMIRWRISSTETAKSLVAQANHLRNIAWSAIRVQFPEIDKVREAHIREGFQVVVNKQDLERVSLRPGEDVSSFLLRQLIGEGMVVEISAERRDSDDNGNGDSRSILERIFGGARKH